MNWPLFAAFLAVTTVLIVVPGPIVTLVIATGARQGIRAALITVAGTELGNVVLLSVIGFGLGWILENAETLFELLRYGGAAYLIWLGIQAWRQAGASKPAAAAGKINFTRGLLVALSNPKTIAFFTAFCRNLSIRRCRRDRSSSSCAWFPHCLQRSPIRFGLSLPALAAPG